MEMILPEPKNMAKAVADYGILRVIGRNQF
jgi:hypothetical protein